MFSPFDWGAAGLETFGPAALGIAVLIVVAFGVGRSASR